MTLAGKIKRFNDAGLYLVTSASGSKGRSTLDVVRSALAGGVRLVQLREKDWPLRELLRLAGDVRRLTDAAGALLIINDRLDVALAVGADGVHLGQADMPVSVARRMAPELIIGASTHSLDEARAAEAAGASYINIGPIFPTLTKEWHRDFLGLDGIRVIAPAVSIPFTVMGGIKPHHIPELVRAGVRTVAVVTAVTAADDPAQAARELLAAIAQARSDTVPGADSSRPLRCGASDETGTQAAADGDDATRPLPILPVVLLLEGRPCLIVGAGKVAARKAEHLVEAGGRVTVVGERISDAVQNLHARGVVRLEERAFQDDDVAGCAVVFAATDDAAANLRVLEACRRRGILCGCVDLHWREGDLISPAVLRADDITVAVSTGGRSCRRSRLVRDSLARHLDGVNTADLLVIGTSHQHIPLRRLESFCLGGRLEDTGRLLRGVWGLHDFLLLSTCNRVELWALAAGDGNVHELLRRAMGLGALEQGAFYVRRGFEAFEHASLLAAGLLSQLPGENHIVAQVKDAIATADRLGWSGSLMQAWISNVLHTSKDIRAATAGMVRSGDVADLVLRFLADQRPDFQNSPGMVIGTGAVGSHLVEQFMARPGSGRLFWCYRTRPPELRAEWNGRVAAVSFADIGAALNRCEYVVAAAGGAEPVLQPVHASMLSGAGAVLIVDVGMPRNVDPALSALAAGLRVVNLDDLKTWQGSESNELAMALVLGRRIVGEHRDLYDKSIYNVQRRHTDE